jgi:hypothetical protein
MTSQNRTVLFWWLSIQINLLSWKCCFHWSTGIFGCDCRPVAVDPVNQSFSVDQDFCRSEWKWSCSLHRRISSCLDSQYQSYPRKNIRFRSDNRINQIRKSITTKVNWWVMLWSLCIEINLHSSVWWSLWHVLFLEWSRPTDQNRFSDIYEWVGTQLNRGIRLFLFQSEIDLHSSKCGDSS